MGGDCLNYGCVPSKALIKSAKLMHQMRHSATYGIAGAQAQMSFRRRDGARAAHREGHRAARLGRALQRPRRRRGARPGPIVDPWHVQITQARRQRCRRCRRAPSSSPPAPSRSCRRCRASARSACLTSDTLWELREQPQRLVVLGGGPIGCELAQAFARLGSQVTQIEMLDRIMVREDADVSAYAKQALEGDGVAVLTGHKALRCETRRRDEGHRRRDTAARRSASSSTR